MKKITILAISALFLFSSCVSSKKHNELKNDIFTIGCVGNFWDIKDQITLIKSTHRLIEDGNKIILRLIGSGPSLKSCKEYVFENNLFIKNLKVLLKILAKCHIYFSKTYIYKL